MQLFIHKTVVVYNVFQQQRYLYSSVYCTSLLEWQRRYGNHLAYSGCRSSATAEVSYDHAWSLAL